MSINKANALKAAFMYMVLYLFGADFRVMLFSVRINLGSLMRLRKSISKLSLTPVLGGPQKVISF
jgi:hypothetical protein